MSALALAGCVAMSTCLPAAAAATASSEAEELASKRVCGPPGGLSASCTAVRLDTLPVSPGARAAGRREHRASATGRAHGGSSDGEPVPGYLTPQELHDAYSLPGETSMSGTQTIAVVDAYDDPTAEADLGVFDQQFGLPPCTTANGCFRKVNEEGQASPLPEENGEWASEISIDVQMAHAICENCHVLLVETDGEELSELGAGVNAAVKDGATEISNSYASPEEPAMKSMFTALAAADYEHPGIVLTAASGDCGYLDEECIGAPGAANFPADSPDVVAVGGTELTDKSGRWVSTVWRGSGGGCSALFAAPPWQSALAEYAATGCDGSRSLVDVAAIGDPQTGVDVYDSTPEEPGGPTGWGVWGGTSVASPIVAAEFALAGGAHGVSFPGATLYTHLGEAASLYDVTSGTNGSCSSTSCEAVAGFDGPSGVGSPIGLGAFTVSGAPVNSTPPGISGTAEEGQTLTLVPGVWGNEPTSTAHQWLRCSEASCTAVAGATAASYTLTSADVGFEIEVQESASNGDGEGVPVDSAPTAQVLTDVPSLTRISPESGITGSTVTIYGTGLSATREVTFGSLAAQFTVLSSKEVSAVVPDGALTSKVSVLTSSTKLVGKAKFRATLSIASFSPKSGAAGRTVTIKGVGFSASSVVRFDGVQASVSSASSKKLKAVVPAGAGDGPISIANSSAPVGTVYSAASFKP